MMKMSLPAGSLTRRVSLQREIETPTGTGGTTIVWTEFANVWANVRFLNGVETIKADFPVSVAKASIRIRYRADVDATCRVVHANTAKTTYYDIDAVLPDEQDREFLDLAVSVGENEG